MAEPQIVLGTEEIIGSFYDQTVCLIDATYDLESLVADSIATVEHDEEFELNLNRRAEKLYLKLVDERNGDDRDARLMANAWQQMTIRMYQLIAEQDLRNPDGRFDYHYSQMMGQDVIVQRYDE